MGLPKPRFTLEEFLAWENEQVERHEFHRGEVFAMVGVKRAHGIVVANLFAALVVQLKGSSCRAFSESLKVCPANDAILYPDIFVTCDPADLLTEHIFRAPKLVIEVLSPGTQGYDRSAKFALYRRLESLLEYGLIDPDSRRVEVFRLAGGHWVLHDFSDAGALELASVDFRIALAELFDGIDPEPR